MRSAMLLLSTAAGLGLATVAIAVGTSGRPDAVRAAAPAHTPAVATSPAVRQQQLASAFAKLPVTFTENRGQTDARVRYYAQGSRSAST